MAEQGNQGTGKHGHKDTQEPYPHHEGQTGGSQQAGRGGSEQRSSEAGHSGGQHGSGQTGGGSQSESLKEREYRDAQGNVHHHTKTYEEQHGKGSERK
jgi:hypothetical protein